eukprot:jgi/Ulvmu1/4529/UM002_0255.1
MSCRIQSGKGLTRATAMLCRPSSCSTPRPDMSAAASRRSIGVGLCAGTIASLSTTAPAPAAAPPCELVASPSGLQFCDTKEGSGDVAQAGTIIRAHYAGRLQSNGVQFDSSYDRGRPLSFKVGAGQVIKGWDEGILGGEGVPPMKAGGKRLLIIPPELGYGQRGAGGVIPPNATLVFDVEYLGPASARR